MAPRIVNLAAWRAHVLARLRQQIAASDDEALRALEDELAAYPARATRRSAAAGRRRAGDRRAARRRQRRLGRLSFISTTTVFGTPVDVTLAELALERSSRPTRRRTAALRAAFATLPAADAG